MRFVLNNWEYHEGDKCPACSSDKDVGGRLEKKTRKFPYLKCIKCKYTINEEKQRERRMTFLAEQAEGRKKYD